MLKCFQIPATVQVVTENAKLTLFQRLFIAPLRFYQKVLSPLKGAPTCRFEPSCSSYMVGAISVHGVVKGFGMGVWRILKCHPFHPGGFDPVPPRKRVDAMLDQLSDEANGESRLYSQLMPQSVKSERANHE